MMVLNVLKLTLYLIGILFGVNLSIGLIGLGIEWIKYKIHKSKNKLYKLTFDPMARKLDSGYMELHVHCQLVG